jgi:hypothetical protein
MASRSQKERTVSRLEAFAINDLKLSHYRAYLLGAFLRYLQANRVRPKNLLNRVRLT